MALRLSPPEKGVEIWHDGTRLPATAGEPLAFALIAANRLALARSPKLHRPRGPYCLSGACDGCLARVDGVPNVMTCMRRTAGGERIETQNVLGSRDSDLLRAADFLFPHGIDHHKLFAGVPIVSGLVQAFARRVAGLGQLPSEVLLPKQAQQRSLDIVVIGGGRAGLTIARELAQAKIGSVQVFDDQLDLGGHLALLRPEQARHAVLAASTAGAQLAAATTVIGLFERSPGALPAILAVSQRGAFLIVARAIVLATGTHDRTLAFGNNDLPGVFSARAALALLRAQISIGPRVLWLDAGETGRAFAELAAGHLTLRHAPASSLLAATGSARVTGARFRDGQKAWKGEAIVIDGERPKALELAIQAGLPVAFTGESYESDPLSSTFDPARQNHVKGIWLTGSVAAQAGSSPHAALPLAEQIADFL